MKGKCPPARQGVMCMIRKLLIAAATVLIISTALTADLFAQNINANAGTSAFPFLKINVAARPVSMGGAFTGLADDESALYYNPAGIAGVERPRQILDYHNYVADMQSGFVGYIRPVGFEKAIGIYASYLSFGDFVKTDEQGNDLGEFGGGDFMLGVTYAMKRGIHWSFGASAKFIYEKIDEFSATGVAVDLGAKYSSGLERISSRDGGYSFGIMVQNLGAQLSSLGEEKDDLPLLVRAGVAGQPRGLPVLLALDGILPTDNDIVVAIGAEYVELEPFFLRLGWNSFGDNFRLEDSGEGDLAGFSIGAGFVIREFQISYAFSPAADLGDSHRITLTGGL